VRVFDVGVFQGYPYLVMELIEGLTLRHYLDLRGNDTNSPANTVARPRLRMLRGSGSGWEAPDLEGVVPPGGDTTLSVLDAIECLNTGREPRLSSRKALQATELIFATYESARRRARVTLPLDIEDSPLLDMIAQRDQAQSGGGSKLGEGK